MSPVITSEAPDVSATIARLRSGSVFTALVCDCAEARAAALEATLREVGGDGTRVVWVGNPLRSALTIERLLLQVVGPEVDLRIERSPAELASLFAEARGNRSSLLVVVQQPESINPETVEVLGAMAAHLSAAAVPVQFLLAGTSALRLPNVAPQPHPRQVAAPVPTSAALRVTSSSPPPSSAMILSHVPTNMASARRAELLPVVALLSLAVLGLLLSAWPSARGSSSAPGSVRVQLEPTTVSPPGGLLGELARMRGRFDDFVADHATNRPPLTTAQKDALFDEFLARYGR